MTDAPFVIDANLADFGPDGVRDFCSPYNAEQLYPASLRLGERLWNGDIASAAGLPKETLQALVSHWAGLGVFLLQSASLDSRLENRRIAAGSDLFAATLGYLADDALPESIHLGHILHVKALPAFWRWPLRMLKDWQRPYLRRPKHSFDHLETPLLTAVSQTVLGHLDGMPAKPVLWEPGWYFQSLPDATPGPAWHRAADAFAEAVADECAGLGLRLRDVGRRWLIQQAGSIGQAFQRHLDSLRKQPLPLPRTFLSAGAGSLWERAMRIVVRETGGAVHAFEHGPGPAMAVPAMTFFHVDWFMATDYHPLSSETVNYIRKCSPHRALGMSEPNIHAPLEAARSAVPPRPQTARGPRILLQTMYIKGDLGRAALRLPDITTLDAIARLTGSLQAAGCRVTLKPHPLDLGPSPARLETALGVDVTTRTFERVVDNFDAIISMEPTSSTIRAISLLDMPIRILSDPPRTPSDVLKSVVREQEILELRLDSAERVSFDESALHKFVSGSSSSSGPSDTYGGR